MYPDDNDKWMDQAAERYEEWLEKNYTHLEIEDGEVKSFERWIDDIMDDVDIFNDDRLDDLDYA